MTVKHKEYSDIIEKLATERANQRVSNGLPVHAAILLEAMFKNASAEMRIFSRELNEVVFAKTSMIDAVVNFISKPYASLKVLLEREPADGWIDKHPLIVALNKLEKPHGSIEIIHATGNYASGEANHFAVMDNDGYRFEFDHDNTKAVANFNEPKVAKHLLTVFEQAYTLAKNKGHKSVFNFSAPL
jgi:hypothetical protein